MKVFKVDFKQVSYSLFTVQVTNFDERSYYTILNYFAKVF